jgi:surface polysaccharide O-acyltransferase-like enzyme
VFAHVYCFIFSEQVTLNSKSTRWQTILLQLFLKPDKPQAQNQTHIAVFDDMRALACLCVVLYHAAGSFNSIKDIPAHAFDWWVGNAYTGLAVNFLAPIFFIISGAIFLRPARADESVPSFLKKRARAILPPFLIASLVYYLYTHAANGTINLLNFIAITFGESQYYHLWFFYTLIGLYFLVPILRPLFTAENRSRVEYLLVLWVIGTAVVPLLQKFTPIRVAIFPTAFSNYTGYFLFGGYFFNLRQWNIRKPWAVGLPILMTSITIFGSWFLSLAEGHYDNFFSNQIGLNIIISTVCLVSLFADDPLAALHRQSPMASGIIQTISRQSLYIYIFHPLANEMLPYALPFLKVGVLNPILRIPLTALFSVILITLAAELASRGITILVQKRRQTG